MELIDAIKQRKTIKLFDEKVKIERAELVEMLTLAQLAPSKANLQPWRFVVVDDPEQKSHLTDKVAFNGPPCESASAVIFILADRHYDQLLPAILDRSIEQGCLAADFRQRSLDFLTNMHQNLSETEIRDQVLIDASLVAMQLMLVVKEKGYDSHAIGIFDSKAVMKQLEINSDRYLPVMLLAIGKAVAPAIPSARLPLSCTVSWNNGKGFAE